MSFFFIDNTDLPISSIAFQTSADSDLAAITCPTINSFDVAVLFDAAVNSVGAVSNVVPSGFTQLQTSASSFSRVTMSYKVLDGSESAQSFTGMVGTSDTSKVLLIFRPVGIIETVTASTFLEQTTDGNPSAQSIAASGQAAPLIRLACAVFGAAGSVPSFTGGTFDATVGNLGGSSVVGLRAGYTVQNSSPSTDSVDLNDGGNANCLISGWIRFT